jgi:arylsulfatase A-like enzyme
MKHTRPLTLITALLLAPLAALPAADSLKPNIIFILVDDMGIGDCTAYNPKSKIPTPNIDRLAGGGMRFTDAHSAGAICVPSRYGLMTGEYASRTWNRYPPPGGCSLKDPKKATVASVLKAAGYDTAMVGKWHLGIQHDRQNLADLNVRYSPVEFGFDYFFGMNQSLDTQPYFYVENRRMVAAPTEQTKGQEGDPAKVSKPSIQGPMWRKGGIAPGFVHAETLPLLTTKAVDYLRGRQPAGNPFFLYFAPPAPHAPWLPSAQFRGRSGAGEFGDFMMQVDDCVGQVLDILEQQGLAGNTLVIFSSDNGPLWFPEDIARYGHRASGIYRGMKLDYYEGGHRVPFIARWPGRIKRGSTSDQLVNFTDMMATFAAIAGTTLPAGAGADSFDLLPVFLGTAAIPIRPDSLHERYGNYGMAYRLGHWKLCLPGGMYQIFSRSITPERIDDPAKVELYDLQHDPGEKINLAAKAPEKAAELFRALKENIERGYSRPGYAQ